MKKIVPLFKGQFSCPSGGAVRTYVADDSLIEVLGQADDIRIHAFVFHKDTNVEATLRLYESSIEGPPDKLGEEINSPSGYVLTNADCTITTVSGPFCGRLRATLDVEDGVGSDPLSITLEIGATLIME